MEELRDEWRDRHEQSVTGGQPEIEALTPSGLAAREHDQPAVGGVKESVDNTTAINPLEFGQAVHEALELADFNDLELTLRRAVRICGKHHIEPDTVTEHVVRALESRLLRRAAGSNQVLRELPLASVTSNDDRTTISEGVADLLFREAEGWILVDYKSDAVLPDDQREVYSRQIQLYASMLRGTGVEVNEAHVLLTSSGESIAVPLEDVSAS